MLLFENTMTVQNIKQVEGIQKLYGERVVMQSQKVVTSRLE